MAAELTNRCRGPLALIAIGCIMTKEAKENNIIRFDAPRLDSPLCTRVETLWASLIQNRRAPRREEITAALLGPALPIAFILDQGRHGGSRFRLAGAEVNHRMGMDVMAMPLTALFHGSSRAQADALAQPVFHEGATLDLYLEYHHGQGNGRLVLFPLAPRRGRVLVLGALELSAAKAPLAGNLHITGSCLTRARVASEDYPILQQHGFAEASPGYNPALRADTKKPDAKRPALRVVKSDD